LNCEVRGIGCVEIVHVVFGFHNPSIGFGDGRIPQVVVIFHFHVVRKQRILKRENCGLSPIFLLQSN
jgi:hypothetical protein